MRSVPVKHKAILSVYDRILRGIHFRHEFARRNEAVSKASKVLLTELNLSEESASSYSLPGDKVLVDILASAYRKKLRLNKAANIKKSFKFFFDSCGVLPLAQSGQAFFNSDAWDPCAGINAHAPVDDRSYSWMKTTWNKILSFELFAMAEFRLSRPIMMPVIMLPNVRTKTEKVDLREAVGVTPESFPAYINTLQTNDVLSDYIAAVTEQGREGELLKSSAKRILRENIRIDQKNFGRLLHALDLNAASNGGVSYEDKYGFWMTYNKARNPKPDNIIKFYKDSRSAARHYRDNWMMIL